MSKSGTSISLIPSEEMGGVASRQVSLSASDVGEAVRSAAQRAGFMPVHFTSQTGDGAFSGRRRVDLVHVRSTQDTLLLVRWRESARGGTRIEYAAATQHGAGQPSVDPVSRASFERWLDGELTASLARPRPPPPIVDPVVAPGQRVPLQYSGQIYDYSALATSKELAGCRSGTLPLGHEAFGWTEPVRRGARLYLPLAGGRPREELGILLCAPQGTGKTHLLLDWAATAARAGRSVFLVDVKGNMRSELEQALAQARVRANISHFTTAPHEASDRLNLLAGISVNDIDCTDQLMRLAEAMLPEQSAGRDEQALWQRVAVRVLRACLEVLKLIEHYGFLDGAPGRTADLTDLYLLVSSEALLVTWLDHLRRHEAWAREVGEALARFSVEECIPALATAVASHDIEIPGADGTSAISPFRDGQRPPDQTYYQHMIPILTALEPFRPSGAMAERVRSSGDDREIRLDRLGRDGAARIVILSAREQDSGLARSMLAMAMRRLRQALDERRNLPATERGEVLLLLDETRRIAGFDAAEFVSIVRQNQVGYVLVYQGLSMIGRPEQVQLLMSNIGTQIYLTGLAGADLDALNRQLPGRDRERRLDSEQSSPSSGRSRGSMLQSTKVPFLEPIAAQTFPAGRFPALVYLRDGPPPFLVDLDAGAIAHSRS